MTDYIQQQELQEQLAHIVNIIDRVRTGTATNDDAAFLESYLEIPHSLRNDHALEK